MADTFQLDVVSPAKLLVSEEVDEFTAPGTEGEFGVLAEHTPFLTSLKAGELTYKKGGRTETLVISRGYAEVLPDKTTILVDDARAPEEIDAGEARELLSSAEAELGGLKEEDPQYQTVLARIEYAEAQLAAKEGAR